MGNELTKASDSLAVILEQELPQMRRVAPKYVNLAKLTSLAVEAKMRNPLLANCSAVSVLNFCKKCVEWGTDRVGAGGVWAVPFFNNKTNTYDMTAIPDWRMLIEKAKKAKAIKHATADVVYAKDEFIYERGLVPQLVHRPSIDADRGEMVAAYCVYVLPDDSRDFVVMTRKELLAIRDRSKAWQSFQKKGIPCPWVTDEAEMCKKTVVKRTMKIFEGASPELTSMIDSDNLINGFTVEQPKPVEMPRQLPDPEPPKTALPTGKQEAPPKTGDDNASATVTVEGKLLEEIQSRRVRNKGTRYGFAVESDPRHFGSFDEKLVGKAAALKGRIVKLTAKEQDGVWELLDIAEIPEPGASVQTPGNETDEDAGKKADDLFVNS